ncbi:MAG: hypothetical protein P8I74_06830, partial [Phycisphaerales bacterium]|nr:hypothetical protein [Phycisphaerales bacterium]
ASLSTLLDGLIDFAGLFPPASLDMTSMVESWRRGIESELSWTLGRIIVPVTKLDEFVSVASDLFPSDVNEDPWVLSVLLSPSSDDPLERQIEVVERFNQSWASDGSGGAIIDVVEFRGSSANSIDQMLDRLPDELFPFVEIPIDTDVRGLLAVLVGSDAGAKIRTGGVKPEMYPEASHLANFIVQCAKADVPFKATAGLHHPLCNHEPAVPAMQFGFLNVFVASLLARRDEAVTADELLPVLSRDVIDGIEFTDEALIWGEHRFDLEAIEDARIAFSLSFGSCSYDDPWDDLKTLGLLPTRGQQ